MAVIPVFLRRRAFYDTRRAPGDLCVSAPTGSGKTLAYVLPIVDILSKRVVRRLRALVILPTRELAIQVKETFEAFVKGTDLAVRNIDTFALRTRSLTLPLSYRLVRHLASTHLLMTSKRLSVRIRTSK